MKKSEPQAENQVKTSGDAYLAAAELPVPAADHAVRAAHLSLDMIDALVRFHERSGTTLQVHMGINSGSVVARVEHHAGGAISASGLHRDQFDPAEPGGGAVL